MLAQRFTISLQFLTASWRSLFLAAVVVMIALTAVRTAIKAQKPSRTGEQSRTAFLRWRPQILALESGTDIYKTFNYPNPPIMALSPVRTKPRVLILASCEVAARSVSYTSTKPTPVPPLVPCKITV